MIKRIVKNLYGALQGIINGAKVHRGVYIGKGVHIVNGRNLTILQGAQIRAYVDLFVGNKMVIGERTDIGTRNRIDGNIIIESDVLIGPDNYISSSDHIYENPLVPIMQQGAKLIKNNGHSELRIGKGTWIGTHCAIIGDVHIGKNCVIGANSVVTKDIPDYSVACGMPAIVIKKYNFQRQEWEKINENFNVSKLES